MDKATIIALGGLEIEAFLQSGESEKVKVKLLKISEISRYLELADDEVQLAAFISDKNEEWSEKLSMESLMDICESAHDLNFQNARRWAERRAKQNEELLPVAQRGIRIQKHLEDSAPNVQSSLEKRSPRLPVQ